MNWEDAVRFAAKTGAKHSVPVHFGMIDTLDPRCFSAENRVIPTAYKPVFEEEEK